jgi:hypothetical protein
LVVVLGCCLVIRRNSAFVYLFTCLNESIFVFIMVMIVTDQRSYMSAFCDDDLHLMIIIGVGSGDHGVI